MSFESNLNIDNSLLNRIHSIFVTFVSFISKLELKSYLVLFFNFLKLYSSNKI